ncbi:MAG TPA: TetR/AcrR family transcriptional regulator [Paraburkholderia sp.]|jgi:AcrR family transcriptional regulator|nr:TetR/AcrR family transcriptional regulator [Paraburkholderia sp.]
MTTRKPKEAKESKEPKALSQSRKSAGMRVAIVRAATEMINSKSYALATLTGIAATLDMRDAALYHYFPSKQALAYACHRSSLERMEGLLTRTDEAGGTGEEKLRHFIRTMLVEAAKNGPLLYFGDFSYLESAQRKAISTWADRLKAFLVKFLKEGMEDGSIVQCEPELVMQLLLGMLIWLGKWVPDVDGLTVDRLMSAIDAAVFRGLDRGHSL